MRNSVSKKTDPAFTLIEVTIALGIAAFSIVAVFGALTSGFNTLRDSIDEVVEENLIREISSKASRTSFSALTDLVPAGGSYFSEQGLRVNDIAEARYKLELDIRDALLPGEPSVRGGAKVVLVKITRQPQFASASSRTTMWPVYVANPGF
jgi:uncharacterized protein (TIGR02598 family)